MQEINVSARCFRTGTWGLGPSHREKGGAGGGRDKSFTLCTIMQVSEPHCAPLNPMQIGLTVAEWTVRVNLMQE